MERKEISQPSENDLAVESVLEENQQHAVTDSNSEIEFTVLDTSFTFGEPRQS